MLTPTTYEHKPLVVAAPAGHDVCAGTAVATAGSSAMRPAAAARYRTTDRRTEPAVFGTWNRHRRPLGFVT